MYLKPTTSLWVALLGRGPNLGGFEEISPIFLSAKVVWKFERRKLLFPVFRGSTLFGLTHRVDEDLFRADNFSI